MSRPELDWLSFDMTETKMKSDALFEKEFSLNESDLEEIFTRSSGRGEQHEHAKAIAAIEGARLHSCADADSERLRLFDEIYKPAKRFSDFSELFRDSELDAPIIRLPNFLHSRRGRAIEQRRASFRTDG